MNAIIYLLFVCHWVIAGLWLSIISSKKTAFHWQSDSTRQIIITVWVDCLVLQLFLPVTLQAQQHATFLIKFRMSFFPPLSPPFPSQRSWKYTSVLQSFSSYQVTGDRARESKTVRKKGKARNTVGRKRGDSSLRGNTYHIKARITRVWHKHCFLCYQSTEAEQNQPICAYTARQPPNCLSTAQQKLEIHKLHNQFTYLCAVHLPQFPVTIIYI